MKTWTFVRLPVDAASELISINRRYMLSSDAPLSPMQRFPRDMFISVTVCLEHISICRSVMLQSNKGTGSVCSFSLSHKAVTTVDLK